MKLKLLTASLLLSTGTALAFNGSFKNMHFADIVAQLPPQITAPVNGQFNLAGNESTDTDGDTLNYRYEIYDDTDTLVKTINGRNITPSASTLGLEANKTYVVKFYANDGVEDSEPAVKTFSTNMDDQAWSDFFAANGGTHDADWKNASISGISSLPTTPFPIGNPVSLSITNSSLSDLDSLSSLSSVGELNLANNDISDITGLANLTTVTGDLNLDGNDSLADLSPLISLSTVSGNISLPKGIQSRIGFAPISSASVCSNSQSAKFAPTQTTLGFTPTAGLQQALATASGALIEALPQATKTAAFGAVESGSVATALKAGGIFAGVTAGSVLVAEGFYSEDTQRERTAEESTLYTSGVDIFATSSNIDYPGVHDWICGTNSTNFQTVQWLPNQGYCSALTNSNVVFSISLGQSVSEYIWNTSYGRCKAVYSEPIHCTNMIGSPGSIDFETPIVKPVSLSQDENGSFYNDSNGNRVPVYEATPQELSDAHLEVDGNSYDFVSAAWDSVTNKPSSYLGLSYSGATNLANSYLGTSDPNVLLNQTALPLPQLATQSEACGCTDANADGACD